jgi:3-isopropylmalate/(R)-2-methylmalate dehydratase large subunit
MTQTIWQKKPATMRINVEGKLAPGIGAKDVALSIISRIAANGAQGHALRLWHPLRHRAVVR